jgi:hypothetical protein
MNARMTASLAAGIISALLALAAIRGLPLGGVLFWLAPFPLYALAFSFGSSAMLPAAGAGAMVALVSGGPAAAALWVLLFGLPSVLFTGLAMRSGGISLGVPFALLALWPAIMLGGAEIAMAGQPGGLSGALRTAVEQAISRMGAPTELGTAELVDAVVRLKPLAFAIWFAVVTTANASGAQGFVARRGLLVLPPVRWAEATLPRWYAPVAVVPALAAGLAPGEAGFFATSLAMMLAVPLVMQGLAVVHVITLGRQGRGLMLGGVYVGLLLFLVPAGLALAGLGLAEFVLNLRGRAQARGPRPGRTPPDDD